ncbi:MAG: hypothetical protein R2831_06840 [Chitinophagaceae bacterium]
MSSYFLNALLICEGLAALIAVLKYKSYTEKYQKYFSVYLVFIFLSELFGKITHLVDLTTINQQYFQYVVIPIEYLFFYWFYFIQTQNKVYKKLILGQSILYIFFVVLEAFSTKISSFLSLSYMLGSLWLLLIVLHNIFELIKNENLIDVKNNPTLYISIGLLIFYIGSFPFYGLKNYLWKNYKFIGHNYWYVAIALNCIMYCMFTISYLCKNKPKY